MRDKPGRRGHGRRSTERQPLVEQRAGATRCPGGRYRRPWRGAYNEDSRDIANLAEGARDAHFGDRDGLLGIEPTKSHEAGEARGPRYPRPWDTAMWSLESDLAWKRPLNDHLAQLLDAVERRGMPSRSSRRMATSSTSSASSKF